MSEKSDVVNKAYANYSQAASETERGELWWNLYRAVKARIRGICSTKGILGQDMKDLEQDASTAIMKSLNTYKAKNGAGFSTWMARVTENKCMDKLREIIRRKNEVTLSEDADESGKGPEIAISRTEAQTLARIDVERILTTMPEELRTIFLMKGEGRSPEEISGKTGLSEDTIRKKVWRYQQKLKAKPRGREISQPQQTAIHPQ